MCIFIIILNISFDAIFNQCNNLLSSFSKSALGHFFQPIHYMINIYTFCLARSKNDAVVNDII